MTESETSPVSRRTIVRVLVGAGIGIPVAIEGATLLGMLGEQFGGGDGSGEATSLTLANGGDDDLLPETPQVERLVEATQRDRKFVAKVDVRNAGDAPATFALGPVVTGGGIRVDGVRETETVEPGDRTRLTAEWELPRGSEPATVEAKTTVDGESTTRTLQFEP